MTKTEHVKLCPYNTCNRLVLQTSLYETKLVKPFIQNRTDKEKLLAAKRIVREQLNIPPSLSELAQQVQLNEYKLKYLTLNFKFAHF